MPTIALLASAQMEAHARHVREEILRLFVRLNVPPDVAVLAMADATALNAVTTDLDLGQPRSLNDRLDAFCARVEATYARSYGEMSARRVMTRAVQR